MVWKISVQHLVYYSVWHHKILPPLRSWIWELQYYSFPDLKHGFIDIYCCYMVHHPLEAKWWSFQFLFLPCTFVYLKIPIKDPIDEFQFIIPFSVLSMWAISNFVGFCCYLIKCGVPVPWAISYNQVSARWFLQNYLSV